MEKEGKVQEDEGKKRKKTNRNRMRKLKNSEKTIFAPQCNLGMYMFDESGDYVTIPEKHVVFTE